MTKKPDPALSPVFGGEPLLEVFNPNMVELGLFRTKNWLEPVVEEAARVLVVPKAEGTVAT